MARSSCYSAYIVSKEKTDHHIYKEFIDYSLSEVEKEAQKYCNEHPEFEWWSEETTDKYMEFEEEGEEEDD